MRPSRQQLHAMLEARPPVAHLSPRVAELVAALHEAGKHVYLVSGGFRQARPPYL